MFLCSYVKRIYPHHQQPLKRTHKQKEGVPSKRTHPQSLWLLQIKSAFYYLRLTNPKKGLILLAFLSMGVLSMRWIERANLLAATLAGALAS